MKIINWRGLHGYGDFIPPFSYAFNESVRIDEDVHVVFHFVRHNRKFKKEDRSTFEEMIDFIYTHMDRTDLTREITYEIRYGVEFEVLPDPCHSNGCDAMYSPHNFRMANEETRWKGGEEGVVAVVSTSKHEEKFRDIKYRNAKVRGDKAWKDAWPDHWDLFCERFEDLGFQVNHVHYEDSVEEIVEKIQGAKMTYGYQAGAMWIARWLGAPMVCCTGAQMFSERIMPWSIWYGPDRFEEVRYNYFDDYETSLERREEYFKTASLYKHCRPGMHVMQGFSPTYRKRTWPFMSHSDEKTFYAFEKEEKKDIEIALQEMRAKRDSK